MIRFAPLALGLWALSSQDAAPPPDPLTRAVESVSADRIRGHLAYLAGDELRGRLAGTEGNDKAAEYIARHIESLGLKPLGDEDDEGRRTCFQRFTHSRREGQSTRNIMGYVEGTDETLKKECVVIGAHMDHVGTARDRSNPGRIGSPKEEDDIWNGADDNGSGTSTLLEICRAFAQGEVRTRRSVVFLWFSAEEWGLLGSAHYCDHPPREFPLQAHAAMINLDMVGRNPDKACSVGGMGTCGEWRDLLRAADEGVDANLLPSDGVSAGSDHMSFHRKGIPTAGFFTGFHPDYHRFSDHPDLIAYDRAAKIARVALKLLAAVANLPDKPEFTGLRGRGGAPRRGGKILGVNGEPLADQEGAGIGLDDARWGIRITDVTAGSVAEKAGLAAGDILVGLDRKPLSKRRPMERLREHIDAAKENVRVPLEILRNGESMTLQAVWGELPKREPREY